MEPIAQSPWLEHLVLHLPIARAGSDPEGVHEVRIAAGRLEVWLRLAGLRVLRDDLRWLRSGASTLRELEVLIGSDAPEQWLAWLEERRALERRRLCAMLDSPRLHGLLAALPLLAPIHPAAAAERLHELVRRAVRRGERIEADPTDIDAFHRLRKAVRRVRYAKEWLGEETRALHSLQSSLGELNDAAVALMLLEEYPEREALAEYRETLRARFEEQRKKSLKRWKRGRLRAEVQA